MIDSLLGSFDTRPMFVHWRGCSPLEMGKKQYRRPQGMRHVWVKLLADTGLMNVSKVQYAPQ